MNKNPLTLSEKIKTTLFLFLLVGTGFITEVVVVLGLWNYIFVPILNITELSWWGALVVSACSNIIMVLIWYITTLVKIVTGTLKNYNKDKRAE